MGRVRLTVKGMHCAACEERVRKALEGLDGISSIRVDAAKDLIRFRRGPGGAANEAVAAAVAKAGYTVQTHGPSDRFPTWQVLFILAVVAGLALLADRSGLLSRIPLVETGMSFGLVFIAGLLTSVHCVGMCGGICLSQSLTGGIDPVGKGLVGPGRSDVPGEEAGGVRRNLPTRRLRGPALYNLGRLTSYTAVGALAGGIGSVVSPSLRFRGVVILAAGVFMVLFGLKMAGVVNFRIRLPGIRASRLAGKGPYVVGFLNGFLPCGPLQAVQLYALGTGSPWKGAVAMALFCLGTMPLLFSFGTIGNLLSRRFQKRVMQVGAMVVLVMAAGMAIRGWRLAGFPEPGGVPDLAGREGIPLAVIGDDGIQRVTTSMTATSYEPFIVQAGVPLEWTLFAEPADLTGWSAAIAVPAFGINAPLSAGDNTFVFTPGDSGRVGYTCWMGMIDSAFFVVDDLADLDQTILAAARDTAGAEGDGSESTLACCQPGTGGALPGPSIDELSPEDVAVARLLTMEDGTTVQHAVITVSETGYSPTILALQRNVPAVITFRAGALDDAISRVSFTEYGTTISLEENADTSIVALPEVDFRYISWRGDWIGVVRVVDDLTDASPGDILRSMATVL